MKKKPFTSQELFDLLSAHLIKQNARSLIRKHKTICALRGDNGLKCPVGVLVSDEDYVPEMEGITLSDFLDRWANLISVEDKDYALLEDLQIAHDKFYPVAWVDILKQIALTYHLQPNFYEVLYAPQGIAAQ